MIISHVLKNIINCVWEWNILSYFVTCLAHSLTTTLLRDLTLVFKIHQEHNIVDRYFKLHCFYLYSFRSWGIGFIWSFKFAIIWDMPYVIFENDCKFVVDAVNGPLRSKTKLVISLLDIKIYCHLTIILLSYIRRQSNKVTHSITLY